MSKLLDLIFDEAKEIADAVVDGKPIAGYPAKLHQDIKVLFLELIGPYEAEDNPPLGANSAAVAVRNELRQTLRQKVEEL